MEVIKSRGDPAALVVGLGPDEKLLESIKEIVRAHCVRNGAVVSGVGTLKRCNMHYVNTTTFPPENKFYTLVEPLEIASINGLIADYEPHLHIVVGCRDQKTYAGHIEEGCIVLYLVEVMILRTDSLAMKRVTNNRWGIALLEGGREQSGDI